mgnify:CR=1 FL=1
MTDQAEFDRAVSAGYNRIPVVREVLSDLDTPLSVYLKLADGPNTYRLYAMEVPDVIRFDAFVAGQPQVLWTWGVPVARSSV